MQSSKCNGRATGPTVECRSEMAGAAEPRAHGNFLDGPPGFAKKQGLCTGDALSHHVCVGWRPDGLTERALEMARACSGEFAQLAQSDALREVLFDVIQDEMETTRRDATGGSRGRSREGRIRVNHVGSHEI